MNKDCKMKQKINGLIEIALEMFEQTTGLKAVCQDKLLNETKYPDGLVRIDHQDMQWIFAIQAKPRVTRATVAIEKTEMMNFPEERLLVTDYVTPPMADLMKKMDMFFMDTAGNAYINKPPLYVFIKGNKLPERVKTAPQKRLLKPSGLRVVFALLNNPDMVDWPYRDVAKAADVALGTVGWIFRDLREMGFLIEIDRRKRRVTNFQKLLNRWVEAYPDQLRPKLLIDRFNADHHDWWKEVNIMEHHGCWGGEVAAAKLTQHLKPEKIIIYANEPPGKLIIENKLRKANGGNVEILKPFWKFEHEFADRGIAPPLLVYADLMATGDDRNIETAGIIYDRYLVQLGRQNR
jgi:hypothetical protein